MQYIVNRQFGNLRASTASSKDTLTVASCCAGPPSREDLLIFTYPRP